MGKRARRKERAKGGGANKSAARKAARESTKRFEALLDGAKDPARPASEIARGLLDLMGEARPPDFTTDVLYRSAGRERSEEVGDALLELAPGSLFALVLRAEVAEIAGDGGRAVPLYEQAIEIDDEPVTRWCYALALQGADRLADSVELLEEMLGADPGDDSAHDAYRDVLSAIDERWETTAEDDLCPCGSGSTYEGCCQKREEAALDRFEDRSVFSTLREELAAFMGRAENRPVLDEAMSAWRGEDEGAAWETDLIKDLEPADIQLFSEWALAAGLISVDEDEPDAAVSLLMKFAEDLHSAPESARRASEWDEHCHYGLWVVEDPVPSPALRLRDILTGHRVWVEMPGDHVLDRVRWEVLLGYVLPVDGIWRMGGSFIPLDPSIGDEVAHTALEIVEGVAVDLIREGGGRAKRKLLDDRLFELPPSLALTWSDPLPLEGFFVAAIVRQAFPELVREARRLRERPIGLCNMDGEPLELIQARISVEDPEALRSAAETHPDIDVHEDEIVWHGRELTPFERDQQRVKLKEQGLDLSDVDDPGRWVRGRMTWDRDVLKADVNSRARLTALWDLLNELGGGATLLEEMTIDPAQDFPIPTGGFVSTRDVLPEEDAAWRAGWVNEVVPGLGGITPRSARRTKKGRVLLEAMLRRFEYEAALTEAAGNTPRKVQALRRELDLEDPWSYLELKGRPG